MSSQEPSACEPAPSDAATEDPSCTEGSSSTQDVVALILRDHRTMEDLLRELRSVAADREGALRRFADLLIAHSEAEESDVYPVLRRLNGVEEHDVEHGEGEHAECNEALLTLLETAPGSAGWDARLETLAQRVTHHLDEEERTLLNETREYVDDATRRALGRAFSKARKEQLVQAPGRIENVRKVLGTATG